MQANNYGLKPLYQFSIAVLEFVKCLSLFFEYSEEGVGGVAALNLGGEWVAAEIMPGLFDVFVQGSTEEGVEVGRGSARRGRH